MGLTEKVEGGGVRMAPKKVEDGGHTLSCESSQWFCWEMCFTRLLAAASPCMWASRLMTQELGGAFQARLAIMGRKRGRGLDSAP